MFIGHFAGLLGPPPRSAQAVAITGVAGGGLFVAWGYGIDRHRAVSDAEC